MPRTVRARAFAKINLTLHVGPLQADGYHPLETVFQSLALHDTITCSTVRGPFSIVCDDPAVPTGADNLVWKAAQALWRHLGRKGKPEGCRVTIGKQIPMAAGFGGGSSDAAAALVALNRLWDGDEDGWGLAELGASIGADVPYFLFGGTALGLGRGDRLFPLVDVESRWVVLACPSFGVSTKDAYAWFDADAAAGDPDEGTESGGFVAWESGVLEVFNDLQGPVVRRHPDVLILADTLADAGADAAAMTGSGSAVFGLFAKELAARKAARAVAEGGAQAILTKTVTRTDCAALLRGRLPR